MLGYLAGGMIVHYFDYKTAFLTCGVIYLISGLLVHIFAKENFVRPVMPSSRKPGSQEKHSFRELATPAVVWLLVMFLLMGISRRIEQPFIAEQVVVPVVPQRFVSAVSSLKIVFLSIFTSSWFVRTPNHRGSDQPDKP